MANEESSVLAKIARLSIVGTVVAVLLLGAIRSGRNSISDEEIVRRYTILMLGGPAIYNLTWLGIPTGQNPNDVWIIQEIIAEVRPDFIVETGTAKGGSSAIWAMIQREVNATGRVISIDIRDVVERKKLSPSLRDRIDFVVGSSVDPRVVSLVEGKIKGKTVLVILDSAHDRSHVLKELMAYAPMVSVGSYVVVQDTNINGHPIVIVNEPGPGPMEAVEDFLAVNSSFRADRSREKLLFTAHPGGYLRRLR
jgi:cephalosporin hydroxylase